MKLSYFNGAHSQTSVISFWEGRDELDELEQTEEHENYDDTSAHTAPELLQALFVKGVKIEGVTK
jgi:hypothetical protein